MMQHQTLELCQISRLTPYDKNARTHSPKQITQIAASIEEFGFTNPVLVDDEFGIIAGHGRVMAARQLGWTEVPILKLSHLNEAQKRAYILADNKLAENAGWDDELLALELQGLTDLQFDLEIVGFETAEIDLILEHQNQIKTDNPDETLNAVPDLGEETAQTKLGDIWLLGRHRLLCGDAASPTNVRQVCTNSDGGLDAPTMMFTDPPYNVPIDGHVCGLGKQKHREFSQASGEMSQEEFTQFLVSTLQPASDILVNGAIAYICMDWRHIKELQIAGERVFDQLKNLCVWNKDNAGMGTFYRSKHELIFVFKKGKAPHVNNFELGQNGRYRTNVWDYAGVNSFGAGREEALCMHPTVKPVEMIADAIKDCSKRADAILDVFGGSGSTLIACEQTGRCARVIELDPHYCDVIVKRWQRLTGRTAHLALNTQSPAELESGK